MPGQMRVAPELPVDDVAEAVRHYEDRLGFEVLMTMPGGDYAIVERDGAALHLFKRESADQSSGSVHIFTQDLDALLRELDARGAHVVQTIVRQPWGNRDFRVADLSGNTLKFTEPLNDANSD